MTIVFNHDMPEKKAYFELFETTGWNKNYGASADDLARALQASHYRVCAYDGSKLVGFGRLVTDGVMHAMIYDLIVIPDYKGRGLGSRILAELVAYCQTNHIHDIQLFAARGTIPFYHKQGFQPRPADAPGMQYEGKP